MIRKILNRIGLEYRSKYLELAARNKYLSNRLDDIKDDFPSRDPETGKFIKRS